MRRTSRKRHKQSQSRRILSRSVSSVSSCSAGISNVVSVASLLDGHSADIDFGQIRRAESRLFSHQQMIIAKTKRFRAANRARIFVAHHGSPDGIGGDAVEAGDQHAGGSERQRVRVAAPGTFAAAHRRYTVDHTKV